MKKTFVGFSITIAIISILLIIFLATGLWEKFFTEEEDNNEIVSTKIVTPQEANTYQEADQSGFISWGENANTKLPMQEGETVIAVLNKESETGRPEEQFTVFRKAADHGSVFITFFDYDDSVREYRRMWDMPIAASRPETISIYSHDLIGDRNNCIIVTGMNAQSEHTMTIFRRTSGRPSQSVYRKIAELQIAGSIVVQEGSRTAAYQQGISRGRSYNIATYGHDSRSSNILDQIETIYSFNTVSQQYEQSSVSRIPGSQLEQRRLRELLSGAQGVFENYIHGLWYYVSPRGTIDTKQYLYFNPAGKEIIFYGDEAQQVFHWQVSTPTRYGLFIRSQNISISTLLRFIDIELESLDRVKLRVTEDVRLKIAINTTWDGSYRRASAATMDNQTPYVTRAVEALYDSSWGRLQFYSNGEYTITSGGIVRNGRYVFFNIKETELLEMRPEESTGNRMVYRIENAAGVRILTRVRLGTTGIQDLLEPPVTLTLLEG